MKKHYSLVIQLRPMRDTRLDDHFSFDSTKQKIYSQLAWDQFRCHWWAAEADDCYGAPIENQTQQVVTGINYNITFVNKINFDICNDL